MKVYTGSRILPGYQPTIHVSIEPSDPLGYILDLNPSKMMVHDYDADCPEWGYFGSGPSQTAAAILYDLTEDPELSKKYHQAFKREFIASYDQNGFKLLEIEIRLWLENMLKSEGDYNE